MKNLIAEVEARGNDTESTRSDLSRLNYRLVSAEAYYARAAKDLEQYAGKYRVLDFSESVNDSPENVQDFRDWVAWRQAADDLKLKKREAEQKLNAVSSGVAEGPFVTDTSDWARLTLKNALYEAAKRGDRYLAWSDPETVIDRWGHPEGMQKHYGEVIPNIVQKLAKEHDPQAKLTEVYPGAPSKPVGEYYEGPYYVNTDSRLPDLPFAELSDERTRKPFDYRWAADESMRVTSSAPIARIVAESYLDPGGEMRMGYTLKTAGGNPVARFRSEQAAEAAMAEINRRLEAKGRKTKEDIEREIADGDDGYKKLQAVEITDRMRDSIKKRGFRMFASEPRTAWLAGIAPALSDREAQIERALKIAGAKRPRSKREVN